MLTPDLAERIRDIFLHQEPRVTVADAARLLGLDDEAMAEAIDGGDIETVRTCRGWQIDLRELEETALHLWPLTTIEEALGREASLVLPAAVRTRKFSARLPLYLIAALHFLAEENGEPVDALLTRELHGLAFAYKEKLAAHVPGFAEAMEWPFAAETAKAS